MTLMHYNTHTRRARRDLRRIRLRYLLISATTFCINIYSDEQWLSHFGFRSSAIGTICNVLGWMSGLTARSGYRCDAITAICVVLKRPTVSRLPLWRDVLKKLRAFSNCDCASPCGPRWASTAVAALRSKISQVLEKRMRFFYQQQTWRESE